MYLKKMKFMEKHPKFSNGMHVCDKDGQAFGRVISSDENAFTIEKGVFFPKDFTLRYDDVREIRDDKIFLNQSVDEFRQWKNPEYTGWEHVNRVNVGEIRPQPVESFRPRFEAIAEETVKVPIFEEELEARKVMHQTGGLRIRKIVHTELRHLTVPLSHEEIRVYHTGTRHVVKGNELTPDAFQEKVVNLSTMGEDVEVGKRTVLKDEVQFKKERVTEQRDVSDRIRSEELEIQREDETKRKKVG